MRNKLTLILCLSVLLFSFMYVQSGSIDVKSMNGAGPVHNLTSGWNYTAIQEAINDADPGDVIVVDPGIYNEDVVVNETISLSGVDRHSTIINGSGAAPVVYIQRSDVVVSNFTLQNNNMGVWAGVYISSYRSNSNLTHNIIRNCSVGVRCWDNSERNFIQDNKIINCRTGVKDWYSSGNFILGNNISLCSDYGVDVEGSDDTVVQGNTLSQCWGGIYLSFGSRRTIIHDNSISHGDGGIGLDASSHNTITNNRIEYCTESGIYLGEALWTGSDYNTIINNTISFTTHGEGLFITGCTGNNLSGNTMMNNLYNFGVEGEPLSDFIHSVDTGNTVDGKPVYYWIEAQDATIPLNAGYVGLINCTRVNVQDLHLAKNRQGILLVFTTNSNLTGNTVTSNYYGLHVWNSSSGNTAHNNTIMQNEYGVWLGYCSSNLFYHNNFTENTAQVHIDSAGSINFWNETHPLGGNYWSDFENRYPLVENVFSGEYPQSILGSDGFWDDKYDIDPGNMDYYPLVPEYSSLPLLTTLWAAILLLTALLRRRHTD